MSDLHPNIQSSNLANSSQAFWLRSSVVSVLFSLISEISLRRILTIILIFVTRRRASGLAHTRRHCVTGLTLPLVDANIFSSPRSACWICGEESTFASASRNHTILWFTASSRVLPIFLPNLDGHPTKDWCEEGLTGPYKASLDNTIVSQENGLLFAYPSCAAVTFERIFKRLGKFALNREQYLTQLSVSTFPHFLIFPSGRSSPTTVPQALLGQRCICNTSETLPTSTMSEITHPTIKGTGISRSVLDVLYNIYWPRIQMAGFAKYLICGLARQWPSKSIKFCITKSPSTKMFLSLNPATMALSWCWTMSFSAPSEMNLRRFYWSLGSGVAVANVASDTKKWLPTLLWIHTPTLNRSW